MDNYLLLDISTHIEGIDDQLKEVNEISKELGCIDDSLQELVNAINHLTDKIGEK